MSLNNTSNHIPFYLTPSYMRLVTLTPMLRTKEIKATIDFYTNTLNFTCKSYSEEWGWATLERDEINIMLAVPNAHEPFDKAVFTGSFYFEVEDINSWWNSLKDKARVCYPLEDFEYGMREFGIYDNNGYLLQFGQEIQL
jgi:uncharacterized glyoxalase superfamily protein PhnB